MLDATADNLKPDKITDDPQVDAATDNMAEKNICNNKGSSKWKSTVKGPSNAKRSKQSAYDKINLNRCCVYFGMCADDTRTRRELLECLH